MTDNKENVLQLLADSRLALMNQQDTVALKLATQAKRLEPDNPETYKCAANACMSLENYKEAIHNYSQAIRIDPKNGNRYFDLGFALATSEKIADAMRNFAKAEELGCSPENLAQLYNVLGICCFDIARYDDALINLNKAEQIVGVDMDILQRKAILYGIKGDIRNGILTANQLKLIAPTEYMGYKIAFKLLVQDKRLEAAEKELERAMKYTSPSMDLYNDSMTLELEKYNIDKESSHFEAALTIIEKALKSVKPTITNVIEGYINAAEINLQLEKPDQTIHCLNAAQNPIGAYNSGFEILDKEFVPVELTEYDVEEMMVADKEKIIEQYGDYGLEEMVQSVEPDEDGNRNYFTEIEDDTEEKEEVHKLSETEKAEYSKENIDQINRLYIGAYTLKKDYEQVIEYAKVLQASENIHNSYIGKYTEANALMEMCSPDATKKYEEIIRFFRNAMIKDPSDLAALNFRIQCYIDIKEYNEAEQLCKLLAKEMKEPILKKIEEAKSKGE